jgi:hypothetical protein
MRSRIPDRFDSTPVHFFAASSNNFRPSAVNTTKPGPSFQPSFAVKKMSFPFAPSKYPVQAFAGTIFSFAAFGFDPFVRIIEHC